MEALKNLIPARADMEFGFNAGDLDELERIKVEETNAKVGSLNEIDGYNCDKCKNRGYTAELRRNPYLDCLQEVHVTCGCEKVRKNLKELANAGLKDVVTKYTFDRYQTPEHWHKSVKEAAQRFCTSKDGKWFFFGGQSGSGKTHICTAIAVNLVKQGKGLKYMVWPNEIPIINGTVNDAVRYESLMRKILEAEVLYIDDLFKNGKDEYGKVKNPTEPEVRRLFEILNYRYNNPNLITIISSERTFLDMLDIDEALAGRIRELTEPYGYCFNLKKDRAKNWRMKDLVEL